MNRSRSEAMQMTRAKKHPETFQGQVHIQLHYYKMFYLVRHRTC